jgi:hypothetical protein
MDVKLTLKLDKSVIKKAKEYAASNQISLSRMIESYLRSLTNEVSTLSSESIEVSPFVKSMKSGVKIPSDLDYKKLRGDNLAEKYK